MWEEAHLHILSLSTVNECFFFDVSWVENIVFRETVDVKVTLKQL